MAQLVSSSRMGNLNSWLYRAASVKTLQKSENGGGGPTSRGGSSQETRREQGKVSLVPKKALAFLHNVMKLPKLFPNLEPSILDSNAIEIDNLSQRGRTELVNSHMWMDTY